MNIASQAELLELLETDQSVSKEHFIKHNKINWYSLAIDFKYIILNEFLSRTIDNTNAENLMIAKRARFLHKMYRREIETLNRIFVEQNKNTKLNIADTINVNFSIDESKVNI